MIQWGRLGPWGCRRAGVDRSVRPAFATPVASSGQCCGELPNGVVSPVVGVE